MTELRSKVVMCLTRTLLVIGVFVAFAAFVHYSHADYEDLRTVLGIFNAYFPELLLLGICSAIALVFYRATVSDNDFKFVNFFIASRQEDLEKFTTFILAVTCVWILFTLVWRDKPFEAALGIILGAFVIKGSVSTVTKGFGNPRPDQPEGK